jgi:lysophospholipase L1-like esterase
MKQFFFVLIVTSSIIAQQQANSDSFRYKTNPNYIQQMGLYEVYNTKSADVVMLGNSITQGVNWNELLGRERIVNRGIASDVIEGFRSRLNFVFDLNPKVCFIMGGINDIYNWIPVDTIFSSYIKLIEEIQKQKIQVVIQSTLYVSPRWNNAADRNEQVEKLNQMLSDYANKHNIIFMDLNSKMSFRKMLIDDLTYDGVHLNGKGYKIWGKELDKVLKKLGL